MTRLGASALIVLFLCAPGAASFAQSDPAHPDASAGGAPKAHAKKSAHKAGRSALSAAKPNSDEADKAARLAEGRKKFFERSMGFDNGSSSDLPVSLGGDNGFAPSAGFKF